MLKTKMKRPGIAINAKRCMACYACFMACKDEHCGWDTALSKAEPEMGQYWMNIVEWERGDNERHIKTATVPTPCAHCADPACVKAAKDGGAYKRPDGIVIIDPEKAVGQIIDRRYYEKYRLCGLPVRLFGVNFDYSQRNITAWKELPMPE